MKSSLCLNKLHYLEADKESGGTAPRVNNIGNRQRGVVVFAPRPFIAGKNSHHYPSNRGWVDLNVGVDILGRAYTYR
jgi:hypothetical protein